MPTLALIVCVTFASVSSKLKLHISTINCSLALCKFRMSKRMRMRMEGRVMGDQEVG